MQKLQVIQGGGKRTGPARARLLVVGQKLTVRASRPGSLAGVPFATFLKTLGLKHLDIA